MDRLGGTAREGEQWGGDPGAPAQWAAPVRAPGFRTVPPILWLHLGQEERKLRASVWGEEPASRDKNLFTLEWTVVLKDTHVSPGPCVGANL